MRDACAAWGLKGEYLLVWKFNVEEPFIRIYETGWLGDELESSVSWKSRPLEPGLIDVDVQLIEHRTHSEHLEVMIAEISDLGTSRVLLWDLSKDSLTLEVNLAMAPRVEIHMNTSNTRNNEPSNALADLGHRYSSMPSENHSETNTNGVGSA